jgi:hypothetical protein
MPRVGSVERLENRDKLSSATRRNNQQLHIIEASTFHRACIVRKEMTSQNEGSTWKESW